MDERFEEYVRARGGALLRFAYLVCGDQHLAEDIVQEVLARVCRKWPRFVKVEQPDAYLRAAVARQFLSWRRRRSTTEVTLADAAEPAGPGPDYADHQALRDQTWRLLATLPRRQRVVLVLRYYEDLPDDQIAAVLGCRATTVRVHARRAMAALREQLRLSDSDPAPMVRRHR